MPCHAVRQTLQNPHYLDLVLLSELVTNGLWHYPCIRKLLHLGGGGLEEVWYTLECSTDMGYIYGPTQLHTLDSNAPLLSTLFSNNSHYIPHPRYLLLPGLVECVECPGTYTCVTPHHTHQSAVYSCPLPEVMGWMVGTATNQTRVLCTSSYLRDGALAVIPNS